MTSSAPKHRTDAKAFPARGDDGGQEPHHDVGAKDERHLCKPSSSWHLQASSHSQGTGRRGPCRPTVFAVRRACGASLKRALSAATMAREDFSHRLIAFVSVGSFVSASCRVALETDGPGISGEQWRITCSKMLFVCGLDQVDENFRLGFVERCGRAQWWWRAIGSRDIQGCRRFSAALGHGTPRGQTQLMALTSQLSSSHCA